MKYSKKAGKDNIILLIVGIIFAIAGISFLIALATGASINCLWFGLGFFAAGALLSAFAISQIVLVNKCKKLYNDPNAFVADAKFVKSVLVGYSTRSVGVAGIDVPTSINVYKKIVYEYTDETGTQQKVKSPLKYVPAQAKFLEEKGTFKIKCKGKLSVIIEDLPDEKARYNV